MLSPALAVFFVLSLLFGLLWLARRKGLAALSLRLALPRAGRSVKQMRVVERVPLTGQHSLHLVSCRGRLLVVAASPGGCSTLADVTGESFSELLSAAGGAL